MTNLRRRAVTTLGAVTIAMIGAAGVVPSVALANEGIKSPPPPRTELVAPLDDGIEPKPNPDQDVTANPDGVKPKPRPDEDVTANPEGVKPKPRPDEDVKAKPDLVISYLADGKITVKNVGGEAGDSVITSTHYIKGMPEAPEYRGARHDVPALKSGFEHTWVVENARVGTCTTFTVDASKRVKESNENNNEQYTGGLKKHGGCHHGHH